MPADALATLTAFSAAAVAQDLARSPAVVEMLVAGGGARNTSLMRELRRRCRGLQLRPLAELGIGDSIIVVESADTSLPDAPRATTLIYVPDTQAVAKTLTEKGWYIQDAPAETPYGETQATLVDHHGNIWYIATFHAPTA